MYRLRAVVGCGGLASFVHVWCMCVVHATPQCAQPPFCCCTCSTVWSVCGPGALGDAAAASTLGDEHVCLAVSCLAVSCLAVEGVQAVWWCLFVPCRYCSAALLLCA